MNWDNEAEAALAMCYSLHASMLRDGATLEDSLGPLLWADSVLHAMGRKPYLSAHMVVIDNRTTEERMAEMAESLVAWHDAGLRFGGALAECSFLPPYVGSS